MEELQQVPQRQQEVNEREGTKEIGNGESEIKEKREEC